MFSPRLLSAALGAGFYRNWHVPAPGTSLEVRHTRRADRSVVGPVALVVLAVGFWLAGHLGASVALEMRMATPFAELPLASQLLILTGMAAAATAAWWWLATTPVRLQVARAVVTGEVARIPDDPQSGDDRLHPAVTQLGHTLNRRHEPRALTTPAFEVLRDATSVLTSEVQSPPAAEQRRLRRRCLAMTRRLASVTAETPAHAAGSYARA